MADLLIHANTAATAARASGRPRLSGEQLAEISAWYRGAVAKGITDNQHRRSKTSKDGRRLARRFRDNQDMILRFATDLTVGFTSNLNATSAPSRSSSALPAAAGAPSKGSPTSQSSSPTSPPPPNGASASSTRCASSSQTAHGSRPSPHRRNPKLNSYHSSSSADVRVSSVKQLTRPHVHEGDSNIETSVKIKEYPDG